MTDIYIKFPCLHSTHMKKMPEGQPFYRGHYAIKPERRVVMIIFALCASPEAMLYLY